MNPNDWEEIDEVLTTVFAQQRPAPFESSGRDGPAPADPSETPAYYVLQRSAPDERLVCLAALVAVADAHCSWTTTRTVRRRAGHLAGRTDRPAPDNDRVAAALDRSAAAGLLDPERLGEEGATRWRVAEAAFRGYPPSLVLEMAATDGHVRAELATAAASML